MARELKVFSYTIAISGSEGERLGHRSHVRQANAYVATRTKKEAIEKFGITASEANGFLYECGNEATCEFVKAKPGQVFAKSIDNYSPNPNFIEIERRPHVPAKRVKRPSWEEIQANRAKAEAEREARKFTTEELNYMIEMFSGANNPVAAAIAAKAKLNLD